MTMNDPHVESISYEIRFPDDGFSVSPAAPPVDFVLGDFDCHLDAGVLSARPTVHFASAEAAHAALEPLLHDWEAELELGLNRRMTFESPGSHVVDRDPDAGAFHAVGLSDSLRLSDSLTAHIESSVWPDPPTGRFRNTPFVGLLRIRRRDLADGREQLTALAYWLLTQAEQRFGGRQGAASALAVSSNVLSTLARLASQNDPEHGRKASSQPEKPLTPTELGWLRAAFDAVLVRAAEADSGHTPTSELTMANLPQL